METFANTERYNPLSVIPLQLLPIIALIIDRCKWNGTVRVTTRAIVVRNNIYRDNAGDNVTALGNVASAGSGNYGIKIIIVVVVGQLLSIILNYCLDRFRRCG